MEKKTVWRTETEILPKYTRMNFKHRFVCSVRLAMAMAMAEYLSM